MPLVGRLQDWLISLNVAQLTLPDDTQFLFFGLLTEEDVCCSRAAVSHVRACERNNPLAVHCPEYPFFESSFQDRLMFRFQSPTVNDFDTPNVRPDGIFDEALKHLESFIRSEPMEVKHPLD